ncbi:MAG: hypothetical protein ACK4NY_21700 [Spirosomataceae bacterium]
MLNVKRHAILLNKTNFGFEREGVLNPAVIQDKGIIHILYRAVAQGNYSTIGYCRMKSPLEIEKRYETPLLFPQCDYESQGMEDPRIVKIEETFYLTYTAYDKVNTLGALATSKDLVHFEKRGIIAPKLTYNEFSRLAQSKGKINPKYLRYNDHINQKEEIEKTIFISDKNIILFPRKINNKFYFLHRIRPDIQIAAVDSIEDLTTEFWQNYFLHLDEHIVLSPKYQHEVSYIGGGCPPIETPNGWLVIYHSVYDTVEGYVYSACASLLDIKNPQIELSRLPYPLFKPEMEWEKRGVVNNVCFPTGAIVIGDTLFVYYGAADEQIACASMSLSELLSELMQNQIRDE